MDACELVTPIDAGFVLEETAITPSADPFESPILAGTEEAFSSACLYEGAGEIVSFVAIGVFTRAFIADGFDADVASATPVEATGFEAWNKEGGIFTRSQDGALLIVVATTPAARDPDAALYLARSAMRRLAEHLHPTPSPTPDSDVAACALLTEAVAEAAVGGANLSPTEGVATDSVRSRCRYEGEGYVVTLSMTEAPDGRSDYDGIKAAGDPDDQMDVPGIGDEAFRLLGIFVLKDDAMLDVVVFGPDGEADVELTTILARQLAENL